MSHCNCFRRGDCPAALPDVTHDPRREVAERSLDRGRLDISERTPAAEEVPLRGIEPDLGSALERMGGEVVKPSELADQRSCAADELTHVHRSSRSPAGRSRAGRVSP